MTDKEIIQSLAGCVNSMLECTDCPYGNRDDCMKDIHDDIIDFINRQQAENERLKATVERLEVFAKIATQRSNDYRVMRNKARTARAEAITDFAEKLKKTLTGWASRPTDLEIKFAIDKVANEMVGAGNG